MSDEFDESIKSDNSPVQSIKLMSDNNNETFKVVDANANTINKNVNMNTFGGNSTVNMASVVKRDESSMPKSILKKSMSPGKRNVKFNAKEVKKSADISHVMIESIES
jgi:acetaldehyde dehydrogenase (acetylating)